MTSDSAWAILEQKYWPEASEIGKYLGAVVKNYVDPSNCRPDDPTRYIKEYDPAEQRVKPRELFDFVLKLTAESTVNLEGKLTNLFGGTVANTTKSKVDLSSKRITLHCLDQDEIYWNEVKKDESVQDTVPVWIKKARKADGPEVCLIIGVAICEGMEFEWEETRIGEREAKGNLPID